MARPSPATLLAQAAQPVLARVRADGERVDFPGRKLFQHLEARLFDADLSVASWCQACRISGGTALHRAQAAIGTTLGVYLEQLRVETAMHLMVISGGEWTCGRVGFLVGYERLQAFRRVFVRHTGLPPGVYRQQVQALHKQGQRPPDPAWVRSGWLAKLAADELEPTEVLTTVAEIEAACSSLLGAAKAPAGFGSREDFERWLMARWWPRWRQLSAPELLGRLAQGFELETPALCELLWCQIGNLGPASAQRGVELAELAFAQALKLGRYLGAAAHAHLVARAAAWLGHARQSARDPAGAAVACDLFERCLAQHPPPPAVAEELRRLDERLAGGVWPGDVVRFPAAGRAGVAVGVDERDVVRLPAAGRAGVAGGVDVRDVVRLPTRQHGDHAVEPGAEGSPQRAEARGGAGFWVGENRGGDTGEQHGEAEAGEETRGAIAKHGGSSLQASAEPAKRAGLPCSEVEPKPLPCPDRKHACTLDAVPEPLVAAELETAAYLVRRDAARAPEGWGPIFEQLEQRLFDPRLGLKKLRRAHGIADAAATRAFAEKLGCPPGEYVTRRRIETVKALLPIEGLTVWACAERVGFTSPSGFEAAYKRLCDETPSQTRARLATAGKTVAPEPATEGEARLRRLLTLQDPPEAIAAACRALRERSRAALRERAESVGSWEQLVVDEWWEQVRERPMTELWEMVDGRLETAAAFEALCRGSREEGRADRKRGLELAGLALGSLVLLRGRLEPSRLAALEVKGFAELGNAYRLVHDFPAAERAFAAAEHRLEGSRVPV